MPDSLNILDVSGTNAIVETTPPVISGFSYEPVYKGATSVTVKADSVTEDPGSGIKYIEWYLYVPKWFQRSWKKIEYSEPYPTSLTDLSWTFSLTYAVDTDDLIKVSLTAVNISADILGETSETKSTTGLVEFRVLGLQTLNLGDASAVTRISDGAAPVVTDIKITAPDETPLERGDSQILVKFYIEDESEITLMNCKVTVGTWSSEQSKEKFTAITPTLQTFTFTKDVPLNTDEVVTVTITAIDKGFEESTTSSSVTVLGISTLNIRDDLGVYEVFADTVAPTISLPTLTGAEIDSTAVTVSATVSDNVKVDEATIRLRVCREGVWGAWQERVITVNAKEADVSHTFTVVALAAGNIVQYEVQASDIAPTPNIGSSGIQEYTLPSVVDVFKDIVLLGETGALPRISETSVRLRFTLKSSVDKVEVFLGVNQDPIPRVEVMEPALQGTYTKSYTTKRLELNDLIAYSFRATLGEQVHEEPPRYFTVKAGIPREIRSGFRRRIMPVFGGFW
jgi:hypothetical protein